MYGALGAWKHLVPGGEPGRGPVDDEFQLAVVADSAATVGPARHDLADRFGEQNIGPIVDVLRGIEVVNRPGQVGLVGACRAFDRLPPMVADLDQFEGPILNGAALLPNLLAPGDRKRGLQGKSESGRVTLW